MAAYRVGNPALRSDEDTVHIPTSFDLKRELHDWEGNALVTCSMRVPPNTTARHLEDAIINDFRLRPGTSRSPGTAWKRSSFASSSVATARRFTPRGSSGAVVRMSAFDHGTASQARLWQPCSTASASSSMVFRSMPGSRRSWSRSSATPVPSNASTPTSFTRRTRAASSSRLGRPTPAGSPR
ncbi:unnamed protein product [Urochloa humidicola]